MSSRRLIIFAKAPILGTVKSRIASSAGSEKALEIYETIVRKLFDDLHELSEVQLRITPDPSCTRFPIFHNPVWELKLQGEGDLGERLRNAFAEAFQDNAESVVIIGSDCPYVAPADIRQAWQSLKSEDLVLGPALDGGYWLIGLRQPCPSLFDGIMWSSENVLCQTLARAKAAKLRVQQLRQLSDIDTIEDWNRYLKLCR